MKKINLFLSMMVFFVYASYGQTTLITPTLCLPAGAGTNLSVSFTTVPQAASSAILTVYYSGDFDGVGGNLENADIFDENGVLIGFTTPTLQCNTASDSVVFTVPISDIAAWAADGTISFDFTPTANVNPTLCNACEPVIFKLEYAPLTVPDDAAMTAVDSPYVFCAGANNTVVTIRNSGTNQLDSVRVNWELNGATQPTFFYTNLLDTLGGLLPNSASINLGSTNFNAGSNVIKAWTSMPNGIADTSNVNDTITVTVISATAPTSIGISNARLTSIDVNAVGGAGTIDYEIGPLGFAPGTGTAGNSLTSMFTISGLTQGTTYDVYVRSNCGASDVSAYVGPVSFNTSYEIPFKQDFESFANGVNANPFPEGWVASQTGAFPVPRWEAELGDGTSPGFGTGAIWDHTNYGGPGIFMFMETSGGVQSSVDFVSPPIYIDTALSTVELGYYYFMFGPAVDTLEVIADTNGVETILATYVGQLQALQTDRWLFGTHFLNGYQGKSVTIIFRGYNQAGFTGGDIAIDDITLDPILPLNSGVISVVSPSGVICPGAITPTIEVKNFGSTIIDSVNIVWNVNGMLDSLMYVGQILPGDTVPVTLGAVTFSANTNYDIDFYTNRPNNGVDQFGADDTLSFSGLQTGMTGAYTVDATAPISFSNFTNFAQLEGAINNFGICGPVTVDVAAGTYNGVLNLESPSGLSSINTVVIDGGDSATTFLENDLSATDVLVGFDGVSYVTLKNMTVRSTRTSTGDYAVIHFSNASSFDSIVNVRVILDKTVTFGPMGIGASDTPTNDFAEGNNANNIVVMNSSVDGGDYNIHFEGNAGLNPSNPNFDGWNYGNQFINNTLTNADDYGIYLDDQEMSLVSGNNISNLRTTSTFAGYGIASFDAVDFIITGNNTVVPFTGIYVTNGNSGKQPTMDSEISNNMVAAINNSGIWTTNAKRVNYWYNSIYCESTQTTADAGLFLDDGFGTIVLDSVDVRNNAIYTTVVPAFRVDEPDSVFFKLDNNAYHSDGINLLNINGVNYSDLASYKIAQTALNASSIEGNPQFASTTNLHAIGAFLNDKGDNSVSITVDIDGDTRPISGATVVDIGADEFNPPLCPPVANIRGINLTSRAIDVLWDGVANDYEYEVVTSGSAVGSGVRLTSIIDSVNITGLNPSTAYDFNVREVCGRGDTSIWLSTSFITLIQGALGVNCVTGNASALITEEFNAQGAWTGNFGTVAGTWNFSTGGTGSVGTGPSAPHSGSSYIYYEASGGVTNAKMVSPAIDLTAASDSAEMSFWMHAFGADMGVLNVGISTSPTGPFTTVFTQNGQLQTANADPFQNVGIRVDSMAGQVFYVEFDYTDGTGFTGDMSIDLFEVNSCISCAAPSALIDSNLTSTSIDLAWTQNGTPIGWEVEYGAPGFVLGAGTRTTVTTSPLSLTGLTPITNYEWYIRAVCAPGDTSIWASSQFQTPCAPFTAPYYTGFEGMTTNVNADCWSDINTNYSATANVWVRSFTGTAAPFAGTSALYINPQSGFSTTGLDTLAAITPQFTDLTSGTKRIRFEANTDNVVDVKLIVGTVNTPGLGGIYTPVDTITFTTANDVYANYLVEFTTANGYNGTDEYIYLQHDLANTVANFDDIRIDEFRYEEIPSCIRPSNLLSSNSTLTSVDLDWTENNAATTWEVSYGTPGFAVDSGTKVIATAKPYTLSGLTPSTSYEYYVRSICTAGDSSFWEGPLFIRTANGIPYTEDWEGLPVGFVNPNSPNRWTSTNTGNPRWELEDATGANENSVATGPFFDATTPATVGGMYAYLETSGGVLGDQDTITSPSIAVPVNASPMELSYSYHMFGANMGTLEVYVDSLGTLIKLDSIGGPIQTLGSDAWIDTTIALPGGMNGQSLKIVFVGTRGNGFTSDMSIDNISVDFTVGIENSSSTVKGISIYPNPSKGLFNLNIETAQQEQFNMTVRDINGKVVYTESLNVNGKYNNDLDFTSFAKGVYLMQIQTETESKVEKLIIQ